MKPLGLCHFLLALVNLSCWLLCYSQANSPPFLYVSMEDRVLVPFGAETTHCQMPASFSLFLGSLFSELDLQSNGLESRFVPSNILSPVVCMTDPVDSAI